MGMSRCVPSSSGGKPEDCSKWPRQGLSSESEIHAVWSFWQGLCNQVFFLCAAVNAVMTGMVNWQDNVQQTVVQPYMFKPESDSEQHIQKKYKTKMVSYTHASVGFFLGLFYFYLTVFLVIIPTFPIQERDIYCQWCILFQWVQRAFHGTF